MCGASFLLIANSEFSCRWPSLFQNIHDTHHHSSDRVGFELVTVIKCLKTIASLSWSRLCHKGKPGLLRPSFFEQVICALESVHHLPLKHHDNVADLNCTTMFHCGPLQFKAQPQPYQ